MRISPLAVWCHRLPEAIDIERAIGHDVAFTHSQPAMTHLCTTYSILITTLISNAEASEQDRSMLALATARDYAASSHVDEMVRNFINEAI